MMNKTVVFLYTELAGYIETCLERLALSGYDVHCFIYPVNPEAPFQFSNDTAAKYYNRFDLSDVTLKSKVEELNPRAIVCSGWIDEGYLQIVKNLDGRTKKVIALDNMQVPGFKSKLSLLRARFKYKSLFDFAWVPGQPQKAYAQKMGFDDSEIFLGFYTADVSWFSNIQWTNEPGSFPKRFVFVGRYIDFKGVRELWSAYLNLNQSEWQLICAGQGPLFEKRTEGEGIHHLGFVQPGDLDTFVAEGGVFILPSHKEPWGVVVHEFAAAGYPLICSNQIGAASQFLRADKNGFVVPAKNEIALMNAMQKMMKLSDKHLFDFGECSKDLAGSITLSDWIETIKKICEDE